MHKVSNLRYTGKVLKVLHHKMFYGTIEIANLTNVNFDTKISCYRSNSLFRICGDMI